MNKDIYDELNRYSTMTDYVGIFGNSDFNKNGELKFYNALKKIGFLTIFDVGTKEDSLFLDFEGTVHYFDPVPEYIDVLKSKNNKNKKSYFNKFGLSNKNEFIKYYSSFDSFNNRTNSLNQNTEIKFLEVKTAASYIDASKNLRFFLHPDLNRSMNESEYMSFLKIDTEGHEYNVILGFGPKIKQIDIIQFEYGGCYIDANVKMEHIIKHLMDNEFTFFYYLSEDKLIKIIDFFDHYVYCNIICFKDSKLLEHLSSHFEIVESSEIVDPLKNKNEK